MTSVGADKAETFNDWLKKIESHIFREKLLGKKFRFPCEDCEFEVKLTKSRYNEYFYCLFGMYNSQVSELASTLFGRQLEYLLINESLTTCADNGKVGSYPLTEFSEAEREKFYEHVAAQAASIVEENSNLRTYFRRTKENLERGRIQKSDLPLRNLELGMVAFVLGEEWKQFVERAATSKIEGFNANARRLGELLQSRSH